MAVDAYQAAATVPIDVPKLKVDVLLGGYLKYFIGTAGVAYMYVAENLAEQLQPSMTGWFAQQDVNAMSIYDNNPSMSVRRFENGTPSVAALYACLAGLEIIESIGISNIATQLEKITGLIKQETRKRKWTLATGSWEHGAMLAIRSNNMAELVDRLGNDNVVVSCRDSNIRVSPHFYNDESDVERLFCSLDKHRDLLE